MLSECNCHVDEKARELVCHGTSAFPIACYSDDLGNSDMPCHWHDELEAIVIIEGAGRVIAGADEFTLRAGEGAFINVGVLHTLLREEGCRCRYHSLVFQPVLVGGSYDSIFWQQYLEPLLKNQTVHGVHLTPGISWQADVITAAGNAWQACMEEKPGYPFLVRNALSEMVLQLYDHLGKDSTQPDQKKIRDSQRMKAMLSIIAKQYGEPLSLGRIAQEASISESECLRCFRRIIHTTPTQYLKEFRLQRAAEKLTSSADLISEIARQCGFQEMSYFSKAFREKFGVTPGEYRQKNKMFLQ